MTSRTRTSNKTAFWARAISFITANFDTLVIILRASNDCRRVYQALAAREITIQFAIAMIAILKFATILIINALAGLAVLQFFAKHPLALAGPRLTLPLHTRVRVKLRRTRGLVRKIMQSTLAC